MRKIILTLKRIALSLILLSTAVSFTQLNGQTTYTWQGADLASWAVAGNWTPNRTVPAANDILQFNTGTSLTITAVVTQSVGNFIISNNTAITLQSAAGRTLTIGNGAGTDLDIPVGSTLTLGTSVNITLAASATADISGTLNINTGRTYNTSGLSSVTTVNGTLNNINTITNATAGNLLFSSSAVYNHARNGGVIPTATWDVASDCNITGVTTTVPTGLNQTFGNLTWNCPGQLGTENLNTSSTVNGTFWLQNINGQLLRMTAAAAQTWTVNNFLQDDGIFSLSSTATNPGILIVSGTFTQNAGTLTKSANNASNEIRFTGGTDLTAVLGGTINSTGTNALIFNINKTAAKVTVPAYTFDATVQLRLTSGSLDFGSTTRTVTVNGPFNMVNGTIDMDGASGNLLDLKGTVTYAAGSLGTCANNPEIRYSGAAQNVMPLSYCSLGFAGSGIKTLLGAVSIANNLAISGTASLYSNTFQITGNATGTYTMASGTTLQLGNIATADNILFPSGFTRVNTSLDAASTVTYQSNAAQTISSEPIYGILTLATGGVKTLTGIQAAAQVQGALNVNAGTFDLGTTASSLTVGGALAVPGILTFGTTAKSITVAGNLSGVGTINMDGVGLAHALTLNGATNTITTFNTTASSGSTVNYTRAGAQQFFVSINYQNVNIGGSGIKTMNAASPVTINGNLDITGATLAFNAAAARTVNVTGNLSGTGTLDMSSGSSAHILNLGGATNVIGTLTTAAVASRIDYNRAGAQTVFGSPNYRNLNISNGGDKSLQGDVTSGGTLTLTSGRIILSTFNLILTGTAAVAGTPSASNYIVADGTGQFKKLFAAGATAAYGLPIGDASGDYSPVSITFSANSVPRTIGVIVTDSQHPDDGTSNDFISRYWSFTDDQAGTYTYNASFTYSTAAPSDLTGTHTNLKVNRWDGALWTEYTTTGTAPTITITGRTEITSPIGNSEFTGRVAPAGSGTYTWNQTGLTADWTTPSNWTPNRLSPQPGDILIFDANGTTTATNVPTQTIARLTISNNSNVSLESSASVILTIGSASGTNLDIQSGSTLQLSSTLANRIRMAFSPATQTVEIAGELIINPNTALDNTYIATNSTTSVTGTITNNGGAITSTAANLVFGSGAAYTHGRNNGVIPTATWNAASTTTVTGVVGTVVTGLGQTFGNLIWNCTGQAIDQNLIATTVTGTLEINSTGANQLILNQAALTVGQFTQTGGDFVLVTAAAARALTVTGDVSISGGTLTMSQGTVIGTLNVAGNFSHTSGTITETNTGSGRIIFNKAGTQSYTSGGTVANTINFTVNSGSTLQMAAPGTTITGDGTFTLSSGATLGITSAAGITTVGTATGNIQTTTARSFNSGANYIYNGGLDQNTGTGLPTTINGNLSIDNAGFTVTMDQTRTLGGNLNVVAGTFDLATFTANRSVAGGTLTIADVLKLGGTNNFPTNFTTMNLTGSTVVYNGLNSITQTVSALPTYEDLILTNGSGSGSAAKTIAANITINNDFTINTNCVFSIPATLGVTVTGTLANNSGTAGLVIRSTVAGTGSLIHNTPGVSATVERFMAGAQWHIISPPVSGQSINTFLTTPANNIPINVANYAMTDYNETTGGWNPYFTAATGGDLTVGKGYLLRNSADGIVTFAGILATSPVSYPLVRNANGWNCIGNPFASALRVRGAFPGADNFLGVNYTELETGYEALYIYDPANPTLYQIINNSDPGGRYISQDYLQPGQGFLVRAKAAPGSVSFTNAMQSHQNVTFYKKSASSQWPFINLSASIANKASYTTIAFKENMTKGLDITYDAGAFGGDAELVLYSRLIEDIGIDIAIQCLPVSSFENLTVPVGLNFTTGGLVTFKAEQLIIPEGYTAIFEDRVLNIYTDLSVPGSKYEVTLAPNTKGTGRFFLNLYDPRTVQIASKNISPINTYAVGKEVFIKGQVDVNTTAILYDLYGRKVKTVLLVPSDLNSFRADELIPGIYILTVKGKEVNLSNRFFIR